MKGPGIAGRSNQVAIRHRHVLLVMEINSSPPQSQGGDTKQNDRAGLGRGITRWVRVGEFVAILEPDISDAAARVEVGAESGQCKDDLILDERVHAGHLRVARGGIIAGGGDSILKTVWIVRALQIATREALRAEAEQAEVCRAE